MPVLREDAETVSVLGVQLYSFGLSVAIGLLMAAAVLLLLKRMRKQNADKGLLQAVLCMAFGLVFSRLLYGLLDATLGQVMPLWAMARLDTGGYSLYGALGGACIASYLAAKISHNSAAAWLDDLAPAFLIFTACERLGERYIERFGLSRGLAGELFRQPWIAVADDYDTWFLMTWRIEIVIALILFVYLAVRMLKPHREGHIFLQYMILFGATQIIMESLRYDQHMTVRSFVRMEQVLSMVMLGTAVIILSLRQWKAHRALAVAALISIPAVTGAAVGIEFMIDRTDISRYLLYAVFILLVSVPAVLGFRLLKEERK